MKLNKEKLLSKLIENARISNKKLSSGLKITPQGISLAKTQLEKDHSLLYTTLIDSSALGRTHFIVGITLNIYSEHKKKELLKELTENKNAIKIWEGEYEVDFIVEFCTANLATFAIINEKIIHQNDITIQFVFPVITTSILQKETQERLQLLQSEKHIAISETETQVLQELNKNPTISANNIAKSHSKNPNTVLNAKRQLEKKGIIKGYSCISNHTSHKHICMLLRFKKSIVAVPLEEHGSIRTRARNMSKLIGFYNYAIFIEEQLAPKALQELRKVFQVKKHIIIPIKKIHKYQFLNT